MTYKILHGFVDLPAEEFFLYNTSCTRSNGLKLQKPHIVMSLMAKFWGHCDFADQSAKLGIVDPYDVLSNFRRGAT